MVREKNEKMDVKKIMKDLIKELCILCFRLSAILPDPIYLKIVYWLRTRKKLNLKDPVTFTEKIQKMKIGDHNPLYTLISDKYEVRKYVAERIGEEYLNKLYRVYDTVDSISFERLPSKFVLKATHDSGGCILVHDSSKHNIKKTKHKLKKLLRRNFYWKGREWCYKNISPRIICEELLEDTNKNDIYDYKFFCFHGVPKMLFIATDRNVQTKFDFFDIDFHHLDIKNHYPNSTKKIEKPRNYEKMVELAAKLSQGLEQVRVDFYNIDGKIYFGEMTLYHFSGFERFEPEEWDKIMGSWW